MAKMQAAGAQQEERGDGLREKMIAVNRVTKVVKGGRVLGFAALTVVGDGDGSIGMGKGKAREVPVAVQKAMEEARRNMVKVAQERHPPPRVSAATAPRGPDAAGPGRHRHHRRRRHARRVRGDGCHQHLAKCLGSTNPYNVVRATLDGLQAMNTPAEIAASAARRSKRSSRRKESSHGGQ